SPTSPTAVNASIFVSFAGSPSKDTGFSLRLFEPPVIHNVTPIAISVGDPRGTDSRRPINVYGSSFQPTDECIFQSASMAIPLRVPLTSYISESHVQCRAPGVALADAVVPENPPEEEDMCAAYASLQEQINTLRNIVNAMKVEQLSARVGSSFPGCPEDCEEENLTFWNGSLETWYREQ
ncbi:unnamed protein product, partial [Symbiodinium sp. CCMP2456]